MIRRQLFPYLPSQIHDHLVVLVMGAYPEPDDLVVLFGSYGSPMHADPDRVYGEALMNGLELQRRLPWIVFPALVDTASMLTHTGIQTSK